MVLAAVLCISWSVAVAFATILPLLVPQGARSGTWLYSAHVSFCLLLYVSTCYHYLAAAICNPGTPSSSAFKQLVTEALHARILSHEVVCQPALLQLHPLLIEDFGRWGWVMKPPFEWGYCPRSGSLKPPRAHYCSKSRELVLNMDHYCWWLSNTVGWLNYSHFLAFLAWFTISALYAITVSLPLYTALLSEVHLIAVSSSNMSKQLTAIRIVVSYSYLFGAGHNELVRQGVSSTTATSFRELRLVLELALLFGGLASAVLCRHIMLLATEQTSVEVAGNAFRESVIKTEWGRRWVLRNNRKELLSLGRQSQYCMKVQLHTNVENSCCDVSCAQIVDAIRRITKAMMCLNAPTGLPYPCPRHLKFRNQDKAE